MPFSWDRSFHALNAFNRFAGFDFAFASLPPSHSLSTSLPLYPSLSCFTLFLMFFISVYFILSCCSAFALHFKCISAQRQTHFQSCLYVNVCVRVCAPFAEPFLSDLPTTFATSSRLLAAAYNATLHTPLTRLPFSPSPSLSLTCRHLPYSVCCVCCILRGARQAAINHSRVPPRQS